MARVLMLGIAVVDFVLGLDELPRGGLKYRASEASVIGGGGAANAAVAAARLGGEPVLAARIGDDLIGAMIEEQLRDDGVATDWLRRTTGARSSFSAVLTDREGERQIINFRGEGLERDAGWLRDTPEVDAVLADSRWLEGALAALALARERGIPGVLDAEAPLERELLEAGTHVAFSRQGLMSLALEDEDLAQVLARMDEELDGFCCVTDGADGAYHFEGGEVRRIPSFPVEAIETLGAGDVWHGAFALRLAEGGDETEAILFANAVAALKCSRRGRGGYPDRAETEALLQGGNA